MLHSLTVSNIVLIDEMTLQFGAGLTVLTGETGAGKSILLDALGLTLGSRADFALIRNDSDQAQVTASFTLAPGHPANARLDEAGIAADDMLILRRRLKRDGKSNASINDVPVSLGLLREIGDMLVEIQGQFEGRGLLDVATHITLLDKAAGHADTLGKLGAGWTSWQQAKRNLAQAKQDWNKARAEEEWLRDAVEQLDALAPQAGEEAHLTGQRKMLGNVGRIGEGLAMADDAILGEDGADALARPAQRLNVRHHWLAAVGSGTTALNVPTLNSPRPARRSVARHMNWRQIRTDWEVDDRLHELRQQGRKHGCEVDELPEMHTNLPSRSPGWRMRLAHC